MTPTDHDLANKRPLTDDTLIEERMAALVGRAVSRQIWLMFLDENDVQMPLIMPVSDIPVSPGDNDEAHWANFVASGAEAIGARSVIVVIERYDSDRLTEADRAWARLSRDGCAVAGVPLRAVLLSHRRGVRLLAPDDYA